MSTNNINQTNNTNLPIDPSTSTNTTMAITNSPSNTIKANSEENTKKEPIPNSLIIYIKTRVPNFYKLTYEPFMTVPDNKSHTIYFDPLVKYYTGPVQAINSMASKNAIFTQFFEAAEFDSMLNRILSDFRYMQKPRTLQQAFNEGIIDNNINITLNTLFKPNNLFYLNKYPYTIVSKRWASGAWDIDKKPIQKLLTQFSHLTPKQLEEQAKKEEDDIPESIRQGNLASDSLAKKAMASYVATGLSDAATQPTTKPTNEPTKKTFLPAAKARSNLEYATSYIKKLFSKYLQDNPPINYSKSASLLSDPLSLSLLIDPEQISSYISLNPEDPIVEIYDAFWSAKDNLYKADNDFKDTIIELNKIKASITSSFELFKDNLLDSKTSKNDKQQIIKNIFKSKFDYLTCFFKLADLMNSLYDLQKIYFESVKTLLEQFKKLYASIINYPGTPELAIKCIDYDIDSISVFLKEDLENKYSQSYFKNLKQFNAFYKNKLYKNKQQLLNPQFNYASELKKYNENPLLLSIELDQFELYGFRLLLFYSYNQLDIWVSMFKSSQIFATFIQIEASRTVEEANQYLLDYDKFINSAETDKTYRTDFLQRLQVDGVKYEKNKWILVKSDGSKCDIKTNQDKQQEQLYIGLLQAKVNSYDSIVLYIYVLEITCLRQHSLYVAEENVNHLNFEHAVTLTQYYDKLQKNFHQDTISYIPDSLFWDSKDLYILNNLNNKIKINKKSYLLYRQRLKSIPESREFLNKACEEIHDAIDPSLDSNDFLRFCNSIIKFSVPTIPPYKFRSSYWLDMDVTNYDIVNTQDFLYNISSVIKETVMDFILHDKDLHSSDYLDWMVLKNTETPEEDSLLAAVCNALNGQLNIDGNDSTNKYTEKIKATADFTVGQEVQVKDKKQQIWLPASITQVKRNDSYDVKYPDGKTELKVIKARIRKPDDPINDLIGKNRFTVASLKKLIEENKTAFPPNTENIEILQGVLKIKFIVFEMFPRDNPEVIKEGDIVYFTNENSTKRCRVLKIQILDGNPVYNLFDGENTYDNIPMSKIELTSTNLTNTFRIDCSPISEPEDLFIYLLLTKNKENQRKYELVVNTSHNKYIYGANDIPIYIIYFLYNNCNKFINEGFQQLDFKSIKDKISHVKMDDELQKIEDQIMENLYDLHNRKIKSEFDHDEELKQQLLIEEIKDLENERKKLISPDKYKKISLDKSGDLFGGAMLLKPSEKYSDYANPYPSRYNLQSNLNLPNESSYYNNDEAYPQAYPQAYPHLNNPYPPVNPGYYAPPGFRRPYRYSPYHYNRSYQLAANKAKDTKSKLAFYIEIELELFPGKTASTFQKSVVRCQSIFERIREAYADIMGYQYRPGAMTEAYAYQYQNVNNSKETNTNKKR
jgi:hypothetical protein